MGLNQHVTFSVVLAFADYYRVRIKTRYQRQREIIYRQWMSIKWMLNNNKVLIISQSCYQRTFQIM